MTGTVNDPAVVAVVVSWNRRELLRECLAAIACQTVPVAALVVVDNGSTDGSPEAVREIAPHADLIETGVNTGGAGGFALGVQRAVSAHPADLVWLMDDDTIPTPNALAELLRARQTAPDAGVFASQAVWTDGRPHPMNTPTPRPHWARRHAPAELPATLVPIRTASFVSLLVPAERIRRRGAPVAAYFLWNDDFEYSARMIRGGFGVFCRTSVVLHKTKALAASDDDPGERFYFEVRNKVWLFRTSPCLAPAEKLLYLAATLRRWVRTFAQSSNRRMLLGGLRRGLTDGFRSRPQSNADHFAGMGVPVASAAPGT